MNLSLKHVSIGALVIIIAALIIATATSDMTSPKQERYEPTGAVAQINAQGFQEVTLSFRNYAYEVSPNTLQVGVPVRMTVDLTTVYGCMRDVVIPEFGVRKYVQEGDNIIEFTPTKTGTIGIRCSMNMGRGTFMVQ